MNQPDIPALVREAQINPSAFGEVYEHYLLPVYRYHYHRTGSQKDAEDLTAQTFLSALEKLGSYRERGLFSGWLFSIAHNKFADHYRLAKKSPQLDELPELSAAQNVAADVESKLTAMQISAELHSLNEEDQELIRLRYAGGLTYAEIGAVLGKREDAVKKSLYRLLEKLHDRLGSGE